MNKGLSVALSVPSNDRGMAGSDERLPGNGWRKRALIVGGGPGGLTAAIALRQVGYQPLVFERSAQADAGSGLTLWPNAFRALGRLGLEQAVCRVSLPTEAIAMCTWDGRELFRLPGKNQPANPAIQGAALLRSELIHALSSLLGTESIRFGKHCVAYHQDRSHVTARFGDGSEETGDLLVACDGINSHLRRQVLGPVTLQYAGYTVWRGIAQCQLLDRVGLTSVGPGAQFGLFPMTNNRVYWFASAIAPRGDFDWEIGRKRELLQRFCLWHKPIADVIEATDKFRIVRTDIYDHQPFDGWASGRVVLLGDAAHPSTPTLGQGACQAIEDAVVLAASLKEVSEVPAALTLYASRRLKRTSNITLQARRFGQMGCWKNPAACWIRNRLIKSIPESFRLHQLNKVFSFDCTASAVHAER